MATAAQRAANSENAKRSCGPKSKEGKARSRLNTPKHGMIASLPLIPGEDPELVSARTVSWKQELNPQSDLQEYLVEPGRAATRRQIPSIHALYHTSIQSRSRMAPWGDETNPIPAVASADETNPTPAVSSANETNPIPAVAPAGETNPIPAPGSADETNPVSAPAAASADGTDPMSPDVAVLQQFLDDLRRRADTLSAAGYPMPIPR
jgi:hypothetical protein